MARRKHGLIVIKNGVLQLPKVEPPLMIEEIKHPRYCPYIYYLMNFQHKHRAGEIIIHSRQNINVNNLSFKHDDRGRGI